MLGENGSGKSTLVKLLSGIVQADRGAIRRRGALPRAIRPQFSAHGFASVFQEVLIAPDRTVVDNVLLGSDGLWRAPVPGRERAALAGAALRPVRPHRGSARRARRDAATCLAADHRPRPRARAQPGVLILDEVTAALDYADREPFSPMIERIAARGRRLILFISHRMDEVTRLSDRISVLRGGRVVADAGARRGVGGAAR